MIELVLLAATIAVPLILALAAAAPGLRRPAFRLLPLAPLPGLLAALVVGEGTVLALPDILLGMRLEMSVHGAVFLGFSGFLWAAAGLFAQGYMKADDPGLGRFCAFWYLTLAGNLGVFIAGDVASFYLAFACVSFAAYPLVVHERTKRAMRAGGVYIVLAVLGETSLLLGFMLVVAGADSLLIADVPAAIAGLGERNAALFLLIAGFGLKAGLVPLHMWLPLAHPAAPTPASAVLSGAIVKAGIFGMIQFLPAGTGPIAWSEALLAAGLFTCWFGILIGLTQTNPKTILAYSTISQMGIVIAIIGAGLALPEPALALGAATLYAAHHGLAKGALFIGVGVAQKSNAAAIKPLFALLAIVALSVAGLPLTGGAIAKLAVKEPLGSGIAKILVILSAIGTSLLLLRFLIRLRASLRGNAPARTNRLMTASLGATGLAALILPWLIYPVLTELSISYILDPANLWTALWPLLVAGLIALALLRRGDLRAPSVPEGDLVQPVSLAVGQIVKVGRSLARGHARPLPTPRTAFLDLAGSVLPAIESRLASWNFAGFALLLLVLCLALANTLFTF